MVTKKSEYSSPFVRSGEQTPVKGFKSNLHSPKKGKKKAKVEVNNDSPEDVGMNKPLKMAEDPGTKQEHTPI